MPETFWTNCTDPFAGETKISDFRHLPIVRDGEVVGIVSRRDFFREEEKLLEQEIHLWEEMR